VLSSLRLALNGCQLLEQMKRPRFLCGVHKAGESSNVPQNVESILSGLTSLRHEPYHLCIDDRLVMIQSMLCQPR
jgi:hypothetical protein